MDLDEDEDLEEPEVPANDEEENGDHGNVSDLDSDHDE
jgi:hypothetical protein